MVSLPEFMATPQPGLHDDTDIAFYQLGMPGHAFANRARRTANLPAQQASAAAANELSLQAFLSEQARETYNQRLDTAASARDSLAAPAATFQALLGAAPGTEAGPFAAATSPEQVSAADAAIQAGRVQDAQPSGGRQPTFDVDPATDFLGRLLGTFEVSASNVPANLLESTLDAMSGLAGRSNPTQLGSPLVTAQTATQPSASATTIPSGVDQAVNNIAEQDRTATNGTREAAPGQVVLEDGTVAPSVVNRLPNGTFRHFFTDPLTGEVSYIDSGSAQ